MLLRYVLVLHENINSCEGNACMHRACTSTACPKMPFSAFLPISRPANGEINGLSLKQGAGALEPFNSCYTIFGLSRKLFGKQPNKTLMLHAQSLTRSGIYLPSLTAVYVSRVGATSRACLDYSCTNRHVGGGRGPRLHGTCSFLEEDKLILSEPSTPLQPASANFGMCQNLQRGVPR